MFYWFTFGPCHVDLILAARDFLVSYENSRQQSLRLDRLFVILLRRSWPRSGDKEHSEKVVVLVRDKFHYPRHAVDKHGHVIEIFTQSRTLNDRTVVLVLLRTMRPADAAVPVTAHNWIHSPIQFRRHHVTAARHRAARDHTFHTGRDLTGVSAVIKRLADWEKQLPVKWI